MKLVIDRSKWYRGRGGADSRLERSDGQMCCLGFFGVACGVAPEHLKGIAYPRLPSVAHRSGDAKWPGWLFEEVDGLRSHLGLNDNRTRLAKLNDSVVGADERERAIAAIFAEHGVEVVFVDSAEEP